MPEYKSNHYVPRFYLSRFADRDRRLWVYDKYLDRSFSTSVRKVACESHFYRLPGLPSLGVPSTYLEHQLSEVEEEAAQITDCWFSQLQDGEQVVIPPVNRRIMAQFITLQLLRTAEAREQFLQFVERMRERSNTAHAEHDPPVHASGTHAEMLWDEDLLDMMTNRIGGFTWVFGHNTSEHGFCTSDHPVAIKTKDSKNWVMGPRVFDEGVYLVYPLRNYLKTAFSL